MNFVYEASENIYIDLIELLLKAVKVRFPFLFGNQCLYVHYGVCTLQSDVVFMSGRHCHLHNNCMICILHFGPVSKFNKSIILYVETVLAFKTL